MSDIGSALHSIHNHLDSFNQNWFTDQAAKSLESDSNLLQNVQVNDLDKQTLDLANKVMAQLNNLESARKQLLKNPNASVQTMVANKMDRDVKKMKKSLKDLLHAPAKRKLGPEGNYKAKTK